MMEIMILPEKVRSSTGSLGAMVVVRGAGAVLGWC